MGLFGNSDAQRAAKMVKAYSDLSKLRKEKVAKYKTIFERYKQMYTKKIQNIENQISRLTLMMTGLVNKKKTGFDSETERVMRDIVELDKKLADIRQKSKALQANGVSLALTQNANSPNKLVTEANEKLFGRYMNRNRRRIYDEDEEENNPFRNRRPVR